VDILTLQDAAYPERLRQIPDPPAALYVKGRLPAVDECACVAVVGTRHASAYGLRMAADLGSGIAERGGVVVSGMAEGCDGVAMEAALRAGGVVIGVLGTSIDVVYPAKNRWLFREVVGRGALVSEHGPGVRTFSGDFKARNRIISGLSLGVAVAEAPVKSGTRVTVDRALEQARDVFAVPANADGPNAEGYLSLRRLGAVSVTSGAEIMERYADRFVPFSPNFAPTPIKKEIDKPQDMVYIDPQGPKEIPEGLPETQRRILTAMDRPDMHADEIIEATGLPASEALAALTMLQVSGYVIQGAGRRYTRK
jgi:DNA processing protein